MAIGRSLNRDWKSTSATRTGNGIGERRRDRDVVFLGADYPARGLVKLVVQCRQFLQRDPSAGRASGCPQFRCALRNEAGFAVGAARALLIVGNCLEA